MKINYLNKLIAFALIFIINDSFAFNYSFKGFGTLQASKNSDDSSYIGIEDEVTLNVGSKLAGQLNVTLSDDFYLTYQGAIKPDYRNNNSIRYFTDLAFIRYQPNDFFQARLGQLRTPFFLYSEYLDTNFLLPWANLPITVYEQAPILKQTGIDVIFSSSLTDEIDYEIQLSYGEGDEEFLLVNPLTGQNQKVEFSSNNIKTATLSLYMGDLMLRLNHSQGKMDADYQIPFLPTAFPNGDIAKFNAFGLKYETDDYLMVAEYATRDTENSFMIPPQEGYYLTLGYKYLNFMPALSYGHSTTPDSVSKDLNITNNLSFISAVLKWNITANIDMKFEYSHYINGGAGLSNYHTSIDPNESGIRPEKFDIISLSVNFIF